MLSALRLLAALQAEIEVVERPPADTALEDARVRNLMTIPGVGLITAPAIVAVIGDVGRFPRPNQLLGYLGLDPRVRQSGEQLPAPVTSATRAKAMHAGS